MKKLFLKIWYYLFPKAGINHVNTQLQKAIVNNKVSQIKLMHDIKNYIVNDLKLDKSKFIPLSVRKQACNKVLKNYGTDMKRYRLKINTNLQLIKL